MHFRPPSLQVNTKLLASSLAYSSLIIKAEVPHFTSITKQSRFSANFLDKIEEEINDISVTVSVISLIEYNILSAGTKSFVYPAIIWPIFSN